MKGRPSVDDALGTVPRSQEKRLEELAIRGRIKIIRITAVLRSARIFRKDPEIWYEKLRRSKMKISTLLEIKRFYRT